MPRCSARSRRPRRACRRPGGRPGRALSVAVGDVLVELGFPAGVFEVGLGRRAAGADEPAVELDGDAIAFDASGVDQVVYRLAPNAGEPARPLARIASGGELSRVALAIKSVLAEADDTPVLVFDEVDTGIGGRSADPVGRSLWALARRHQVLCVTHLPQIAAHADAHFRIAKRERDGPDRDRDRATSTARAGSSSSRRCSAARRAARRPWRRPASSSTVPRRGTAGSPAPAEAGRAVPAIDDAIEGYLTYLHVERGLAPATIRAYRADLDDFAASRGAAEGWGRSPDVALDYLAARTRRGRRGDPGLAPSSLRRRAAALKGFYRFAYGEGLIGTDVAAHLDLPRPSRLLPETLTVAETERLLEAAGPDERSGGRRGRGGRPRRPGPPRPGPARAAVRGRPADQRGDRARPRGPVARRRLRPGHRQGRQGAARAGRRRRARLARGAGSTGRARRLLALGARGTAARRPAVPRRPRRAPRAAAGVGRRQARGRARRPRRTGSARTRCATRSRPTCSRAAPTCGSSRSCSDMRVSPPRSSTRT